ncbi:uncharacterized protein LOC129751606 [Uranotaenia lowii]|uniref:uncharacterized protein LOC129751606 n=1 Tax=Uranotaenia lowii TaxID=190385 RepID=UPI00247884D7|nr:uncharacterized protein LOC129751606 [Uranotaenia lowii]
MAGHNLDDNRQRSSDVECDRSLEFAKMFLSEALVRGLTRNSFIHPSPIQARAIPLGRLGLDLLVQAKSGTGKTLVFSVLIVETHNPDCTFPQALILVPTREIAVQIEKVLNKIAYSVPNFKARSFIGGMDISQDRKNLQGCSTVVGTPGRINHLIKTNVLNTRMIKLLVLDEADSLISGTLKPELNQIITALPKERQTIVCSATYYKNRDKDLLRYMNDKYIGVTPKKEAPILHGIRQFVRELPEAKDNIKETMGKIEELNRILKKVPYSQCLIFANTQTKAETYGSYLNRAGWPTEVIRGGMEQRVRLKTVENLREFRCRILTATDVISRGIDAENVNLVINVDVPKDNSIYLHRIGRGGRFGTQAIAITLISSGKDMEKFRKILNDIGGTDMFVYHLPSEKVEEIWNFEEYGDKYGKLYASKLEQQIRDSGADRAFLEAIEEVDSKTELDRKSNEMLTDSLDEIKAVDSTPDADSIEQMADKKAIEKPGSDDEGKEEEVERIICLSNPDIIEGANILDSTSEKLPEETIGSADKGSNDKPNLAEELDETRQTIPDSTVAEPKSTSSESVDQMFMAAMEEVRSEFTEQDKNEIDTVDHKVAEAINQLTFDEPETTSQEVNAEKSLGNIKSQESVDEVILAAIEQLEFEDSSDKKPAENGAIDTDAMFLAAMEQIDLEDANEEDIVPQVKEPESPSPDLSCSTPESCYTTDSSFSSNATKKVEVGSNFTTPNSRVHEIRGAAPPHQVSSSTSDTSSEVSHLSDPIVPAEQNCMPLEVNNDALFAKIMEQKELEADHQHRPFQFSIDGCSLEVHDDPLSERDINSRKGSVPDVVPSGITMDPSRLQNRPPSSMEGGEITFEFNSNTCGSNHGSVFEHDEEEEEEVHVQPDQRTKRIRFQQDDHSLEHQPSPDSSQQQLQPPAMAGDQDLPPANPEADDASSYSSEYDSESSNSSFVDPREWEAELEQNPESVAASSSTHGRVKAKTNKRTKNATNRYHRMYATWTDHYWNQMTMIRDYARFAVYSGRQDD